MLEKTIQANIIKKFRQLGVLVVKVHSESTAGWPDLLCIDGGNTFYIEVKQPTGRLSTIQKHVIKEIENHGGRVYIATSGQDVADIYEEEKLLQHHA